MAKKRGADSAAKSAKKKATKGEDTSRKRAAASAKPAPPEPKAGIPEGQVVEVALDQIDLEDRTFQFRLVERVTDLKRTIEKDGQQVPVVLRRREGEKFQVISGFRRIGALRELGWPTVKAIVRDDLQDDDAAFRAAVLENSARKSYSDVDRAYAIKAYKDRKYKGREVADLMGLSKRQTQNLQSLLDLPAAVQEAIDDPEQHFGTTHALTLKKLKAQYPTLDYEKWIAQVNADRLSVSRLKLAVGKERAGSAKPAGYGSMFNSKRTDWDSGVVRLSPRSFDIDRMSDSDLEVLEEEVKQLQEAIERRRKMHAREHEG